jgi:hypothetical protein
MVTAVRRFGLIMSEAVRVVAGVIAVEDSHPISPCFYNLGSRVIGPDRTNSTRIAYELAILRQLSEDRHGAAPRWNRFQFAERFASNAMHCTAPSILVTRG